MLYRITNKDSGVVLGEFVGDTEAEALDDMAQFSGYHNYSDVADTLGESIEYLRNQLIIEQIDS